MAHKAMKGAAKLGINECHAQAMAAEAGLKKSECEKDTSGSLEDIATTELGRFEKLTVLHGDYMVKTRNKPREIFSKFVMRGKFMTVCMVKTRKKSREIFGKLITIQATLTAGEQPATKAGLREIFGKLVVMKAMTAKTEEKAFADAASQDIF